MKLSSLPDLRAEHDPHGPAVADARQTLTNAPLLDRVTAAAHQLGDMGIGAGDVVAVKLHNRVEFVVLLFASWRARSLAGYKRPTTIVVVDAIPKNPVGKTDKAPLRAAHAAPATKATEEATR